MHGPKPPAVPTNDVRRSILVGIRLVPSLVTKSWAYFDAACCCPVTSLPYYCSDREVLGQSGRIRVGSGAW
ncbi:hypothetical protein HYQ46_002926 [Verticillium longisporum]|nr:hypothetical protein HYQ46_002926 [Verticillium longisporum]